MNCCDSQTQNAMENKIKSLAEGSAYTTDQLHLLLGKLSNKPLDDDVKLETIDENEAKSRYRQSQGSTFLFGASLTDLSTMGSGDLSERSVSPKRSYSSGKHSNGFGNTIGGESGPAAKAPVLL